MSKEFMVAIDVGTKALGFAFFAWNTLLERPLVAAVLTPRKVNTTFWMDRLHWMADQLEEEVDRWIDKGWNPKLYAMEWPEFRPSAGGMAAAATDALGQLAAAVGYHSACAHERNCLAELVRVSHWKGVLPKTVVEARLRGRPGLVDKSGDPIKSHAVDAVGIGLFVKGFPMNHPEFCGKAKPSRVKSAKQRARGENRG